MSGEIYSRVYELARQIPRGRVSSYGRMARLLGEPRWARLVGYAMRACHDPTVPCHRVLRHDGSLAVSFGPAGPELQQALLEAEGVTVQDGRVDLARFGWDGD
ncbi:MAG: MGMT family protein [Firmicutes bacterium]|nr:MGMT family protein [Bacillota bacterium]